MNKQKGTLLYDCTMYGLKSVDEIEIINYNPNEQEVLRYGEYIVDEEYREHIGFNRFDSKDFRYCRIRLISYQGNLYYHKMATGETLEFKKVGRV